MSRHARGALGRTLLCLGSPSVRVRGSAKLPRGLKKLNIPKCGKAVVAWRGVIASQGMGEALPEHLARGVFGIVARMANYLE